MKKGFSLIEILVSITILAIMSTVGIASYRNTAINQALLADVDQIIQVLNIAKTNVNSGKKVSCSSSLVAWQVSFSQKSFDLQERCGETFTSNTYNLASNNTISANPAIISFYALGKGATVGTVTIGTKVINISLSGNIQ